MFNVVQILTVRIRKNKKARVWKARFIHNKLTGEILQLNLMLRKVTSLKMMTL